MNHKVRYFILIPATIIWTHDLSAQRGGCVVTDTAAVYERSSGDKLELTASKGDCLAGIKSFEKEGERVHVMYIAPKGVREHSGWMEPATLSFFAFDCGCDRRDKCSPIAEHFAKHEWNDCFKMARDRALAAASTKPELSQPVKPFTNEDVITLTQAGLGDDIVLAKVSGAPATKFDTSVDALIRLKKEGVPKSVIEAMVKQPERAAPVRQGSEQKVTVTHSFQVRVTSNAEAVKGCKSLGVIHAKTFAGGTGAITRKLQEQALGRGANVVLMMGSMTAVTDTDLEGNGEAYACVDQ